MNQNQSVSTQKSMLVSTNSCFENILVIVKNQSISYENEAKYLGIRLEATLRWKFYVMKKRKMQKNVLIDRTHPCQSTANPCLTVVNSQQPSLV